MCKWWITFILTDRQPTFSKKLAENTPPMTRSFCLRFITFAYTKPIILSICLSSFVFLRSTSFEAILNSIVLLKRSENVWYAEFKSSWKNIWMNQCLGHRYLYFYYSTYLIKQHLQENDQTHHKISQGC